MSFLLSFFVLLFLYTLVPDVLFFSSLTQRRSGLDSPNSCNGLTAAWSSCTTRLRVMRVPRRRRPPNFMLLLEVFSNHAAWPRGLKFISSTPWAGMRGWRKSMFCERPSPAQKLTLLETHTIPALGNSMLLKQSSVPREHPPLTDKTS